MKKDLQKGTGFGEFWIVLEDQMGSRSRYVENFREGVEGSLGADQLGCFGRSISEKSRD